MMLKKMSLFSLLVFLLAVSGCADQPTPPPATAVPSTPMPAEQPAEDITTVAEDTESELAIRDEGIFISELLPGVPGGNNWEFIELYNAGTEAVDLNGWSLWYLLSAGQEESLVYAWGAAAEIPGQGHYLLVREGQLFDIIPDATFDVSLFERKGGVVLRDAEGNDVDQLGWGDAPAGFFAGTAVPAPTDGASIERLPGGEMGNGVNSSHNADDMVANGSPNPQNSGSPLTPLPAERLAIRLGAPETVAPGAEFEYVVEVENLTATAVSNVQVSVPVSPHFTILSLPDGAIEENGRVTWAIDTIGAGETATAAIGLQSPFTYIATLISGYYAESAGLLRAYGPLQPVAVAGGAIPIAAARSLTGNTVTVEGTATMYSGGFFAGSGVKFYLEDESGGIQVYVPGGSGTARVNIGDRLRVTGEIEIYRDSVEVIPGDTSVDIEVIEAGTAELEPTPISVLANETDDAIIGRLTSVQGTATRIEEFTYSYEIDLTDDEGNTALVYIDKLTNATTEPLDVGKQYRITGISEFYSGQRRLYPRLQTDMVEIFPPLLLLTLAAANNALPGAELVYTITAVNHTDAPLNNLQITAVPPATGTTLNEIGDDGRQEGEAIVWAIDQLAGDGSSITVSYSVILDEDASQSVSVESVTAVADEWPDPATTDTYLTFIGSGLPIWAIQGSGMASPYVRSEATTEGVVTAVFPELQGFWLQEMETDDDPATSAGLFILVDGFDIPVAPGDLTQVTGRVREISGQTTLHPQTAASITILSSDNALPLPVNYDPPQDVATAIAYNESLEGMLVAVNDPAVAIAPTTRYGEYVLVSEKWGVDTVRRGEEVGYLIFADDGSSAAHIDQSTLPYAVQRGDLLTGLVGPLAFTFDNYKIEPVEAPQIVRSERPLPTFPAAAANQFSVATFNVENLFDLVDPHPSSPPRPTLAQYRLKLNKLAEAILAMGVPTIVGLQEVENIGVLEDLVELEQLAAYGYVPYLIEGSDARGIDVGYIVRGDQATVEGVDSYVAPEGLTSRPPLVITVTVHLDAGDETVYVLNNHFTSLSAGEEATEPRRNAQAAWNVTVMAQIRAANPDARFILMGDLNSFYDTLPIHTLQVAGLRHLYEFFEDEPLPYTYIFQGATQTLDHILVSEELFTRLVLVDALQISADYPITDPEDTSARRLTDHDPLIAIFSFEE